MAPKNYYGLGILDTGEWPDDNDRSTVSPYSDDSTSPNLQRSSSSVASSISTASSAPPWKPAVAVSPRSSRPHLLSRVLSAVTTPSGWPIIGSTLGPKPTMQPSPRRTSSSNPSRSATAYLDGLRGFAAFLVYLHHHNLWAHASRSQAVASIFEAGFGRDDIWAFCAFPFARIFFTGGHFAVAIFFVISGYVLSAGPLAALHSGERSKMDERIASALFRRWMRLYIPLACTTFLFMLTWHVFSFGGRKFPLHAAEPQGSLRDEIWKWYAEFKNFSFVFNQGGLPWFTYNPHTWSIPVEMKGSLVVYTTLQALSRASTTARVRCTAALAFYFLYIADGWYGAAFLLGMLMCDLDHLSSRDQLPFFIVRLAPRTRGRRFIAYHLFVLALYLGGVPSLTREVSDLRATRGWYYLSFLKPQAVFDYKWFYLLWGAVAIVWAIPRIPRLRRFFESRFCQHLGRISYALYLLHGPVIWLLGDRIYAAVGYHDEWHRENIPGWIDKLKLPDAGPLGLEVSFLLPHIVLLPLTLWLAELGTRAFDEPAVRFAGWMYRKVLASSSEKK